MVLNDLASISEVWFSIKSPSTGQVIRLNNRPKLTPSQAKAIELLHEIPLYP
jgi:hypothetical protein